MPETPGSLDCNGNDNSIFCNGFFRCCNDSCSCCGYGCGICGACSYCGNCDSCNHSDGPGSSGGGCNCFGSGCDTGSGCDSRRVSCDRDCSCYGSFISSCGGGPCRAWLVVCACFCLNFLVDGIASCFGVLLPELSTQIGATIADTAWAGSALCGGQLIAGPLVSALVSRLGCRTVVIAGSLISSVAFSLSASASEVGLFIFMYGILGGLGLGMMYLPSVVAVSIYFDTNRALATGIVVCGSGVGTFCLAPLTQHLLAGSGWRSVQLAMAALLLTGVLMGSVMAEPSSSPDKCPPCCCPKAKPPSSDTSAEIDADTENDQHADEERPHSHSSPVDMLASGPSSARAEDQKTTPAPAASPDDAILATSSGSYVKMTSPAVPSNAGDLVVDSPPPAGQVTPPKVFLFPDVLVESASSASVVEVEDDGASGFQKVPELVISSHDVEPGGLFPDDALHRRDLAASRSHLLSPRRRLSCLGRPASGQLRPVSGLLSPRRAISTPHHPLSPHTPAVGRGPVSAHLRPLQRPDVFFSGRVQPAARRRRLPPGGVPASPSSLPSAPAAAGCLDSDVQRRLALGSVGSMETMMIGSSTPTDGAAGDSFAVLKEMLDMSLLRQPPFLLTCLGYSLSMLGYFVPIVYILDEAVQHGVSPGRASLLVAVMGASNTVGRLVVGVLSGLQYMDVLLLNNVSMLGSGLVALLFPFCETYSAYAFTAAVFGLLAAANSTLSSLVLLEMVGLARLTNAFGLTLLFRGVAAVLGTPLAGFLAERTGSYDQPFYMTGALLIIASLLGFLATAWDKWSCRAKPDDESTSYRRADSVDT